MLEKRTVIDKIEILRNGVIQLRFSKEIVENNTVIAKNYHRTVITPATSPEEQISSVNNHLEQLGEAQIQQGCMDKIISVCETVHTPEVIDEFQNLIENIDLL